MRGARYRHVLSRALLYYVICTCVCFILSFFLTQPGSNNTYLYLSNTNYQIGILVVYARSLTTYPYLAHRFVAHMRTLSPLQLAVSFYYLVLVDCPSVLPIT